MSGMIANGASRSPSAGFEAPGAESIRVDWKLFHSILPLDRVEQARRGSLPVTASADVAHNGGNGRKATLARRV
jgi:hypothetical protein